MAAQIAVALANGVLGKLGEIAFNEASLLFNFKSDFTWLKNKLSQLCASLQAADDLAGHTDPVKKWLTEVRNIVFDAEDIIDEYVVERLDTNTSQWCVCNCNQLVFQYKIGRRIRELKDRIRSNIEEAKRLKIFHDVAHQSQPSTSTSQSERGAELRRSSIPDQDSPAVAIDYKVDEIVALLENPSIRVVAVLGMGGVGKTYLMQHVFNRVRHRYVYSAWISVSQSSSLRSLQNDLASHIGLDIDNRVTDVRASELIYSKLEGNTCFIVLDDVWSNSVQGDLISRMGFPSGSNNQCKIVVTTRSRDVAESMNAQTYVMQHLFEDESWNLFCCFAFQNCEGKRPPNKKMEILARGIVEECGRLPLALKTVAASLAKSSLTSDHWESKLGQLKKITKTDDFVMKILKLSYDSLPPNLKSCFAYLSFFPEDTHISISSFRIERAVHQECVIYLWIAEGCIPQEEDREHFDIGLDYLHQLENLCLLEVNRVFSSYTVHDLLLDLAVDICKEHECEFDLPSRQTSCRRLLLSKKSLDDNVISERHLRQQFLRTLSFSHNSAITNIPQELLDHARLLRVIDLSRTSISTLPKCVGKLKLLKVLNLSHTKIREVPDCVRRLKSLQFLDVSHCTKLQSVPDWIGELNCLSYLNVQVWSHEILTSHMPKGMSKLSSLRTLRSECFPLDTEENEFLNVKDVGSLINLRELSFRLKDVGGLRSVEDGALDRLVKMRILAVENKIPEGEGDGEEPNCLPAFPEKLSVMKGLQQVVFRRFSVPNWIRGMENLTRLFLCGCSDYSSLQKMPSLEFLSLQDDSKCRELPKKLGERGGFPKLFKMQIINFCLLEELPALEEGAMQRLESLRIHKCPRVERVPEGLEGLRRLKRISVVQVSDVLEQRLREGGEDWRKIKSKNPRIEIVL